MGWAFGAFVLVAIIATGKGWDSTAAIAVGLVAGAVVWFLHSRLFPFAKCLRCNGSPRTYDGSVWRECGSCGGSGKRRRFLAGAKK
jgi:hypothetical protein